MAEVDPTGESGHSVRLLNSSRSSNSSRITMDPSLMPFYFGKRMLTKNLKEWNHARFVILSSIPNPSLSRLSSVRLAKINSTLRVCTNGSAHRGNRNVFFASNRFSVRTDSEQPEELSSLVSLLYNHSSLVPLWAPARQERRLQRGENKRIRRT